MSASFFELLKYAKTGIASPEMTAYDKMRALSMAGGGATKTLTGVPPLAFKADGKPLISWSMLGNGQQAGTPTPDSPIMPEFVGAMTANLFDQTDFKLFQVTTTAYRYGSTIGVLPQGTYTFNATKSVGAQSIFLTAKLNGTYSQTTISSVPFTFSADGESEYIIRTANNTGTTWEAEKYSDMMLNSGSTALPYEPFGWKIPITCAGQTVPVYLGQTQTVRRVQKLVLDGTEDWQLSSTPNQFYMNSVLDVIPQIAPMCTHFKGVDSFSADGQIVISASRRINIRTTYIQYDLTNWITYLQQQYTAGTPVMIWYVLATPTTGIVNEPLCKIGDYADELNSTDAGVSIPTAKGANTLAVDTDLQPSSMTITYR